jgi:hypothetical protein
VSAHLETSLPVQEDLSIEKAGSSVLRIITWLSVGIAVAAVGIFVGAELRSRYKFKRRTPYDFYSNSSETGEFGVGI